MKLSFEVQKVVKFHVTLAFSPAENGLSKKEKKVTTIGRIGDSTNPTSQCWGESFKLLAFHSECPVFIASCSSRGFGYDLIYCC